MKLRDLLSGLFWLAISVYVCLEAVRTNVGSFKVPGPGFLPFWGGVSLGTFSILLMISRFLKKRQEGEESPWKGIEWQKVIMVLVILFAYAIVLTTLGYLIATFGLMLLLLGSIERTPLWIKLVSSLLIVSLSYLLFSVWLGIPLPKGILGL